MTDVCIDLVDACRGTHIPWRTVYEDKYVRRRTAVLNLRPDLQLEILADCLVDSQIECFHMSLVAAYDATVDFQFPDTAVVENIKAKLCTSVNGNYMFWMPLEPKLREYDIHGRVIDETAARFEAAIEPCRWGFRTRGVARHKTQFGLVLFDADAAVFRDELTVLRPLESLPVKRNTWFLYERLADVWRYFVDGVFLHRPSPGRKGFQSQNIAYTLYFHLRFLATQTGKRLYRSLADLIAYSVLLSLPSDGRWRHGIWTDEMETHAIHQVSGIQIFLDAYERTRNQIFLDKSQAGADYLVSVADPMRGHGRWFLHDTLECDLEVAKLHYRHMDVFEAFGKSSSNTLTLNTHLSTITVLCHLQNIVQRTDYDRCIDDGLAALRSILQTHTAQGIYAIVYGLRDRLIKRSTKVPGGLAARLSAGYDHILRRKLLPYLKRRYPRLAMPDGYIERDLTHTALSDFYHMINAETMLKLYCCRPDQWLATMIKKSVDFILRNCLAEYMRPGGFGTGTCLGVLLLYAAVIDESSVGHLARYVQLFREMAVPVPVKILSCPGIADPSSPWAVDNANMVVLSPAHQSRFAAVVINPTRELQVSRMNCILEPDAWQLLNSEGRSFPAAEPLSVPPGSYIKIVKKA